MQGQSIWPVNILLMKNSTNLDLLEMTVSLSMKMKGRKKKYCLVQEERKGGNIEVLQYKYKKHWYDILKKSEVDELLRLAHTHQWEKDEDKKTRVGIFV